MTPPSRLSWEPALDAGYGLRLRREAMTHGSDRNALNYLLSPSVQKEVDMIVKCLGSVTIATILNTEVPGCKVSME